MIKLFKRSLKRSDNEYITITAFLEDESERIARALGLHEQLEKGQARCLICGSSVSYSNLGGFVKTGEGVKVVCENPVCLAKAYEIAKLLRQTGER